MTTQIAVRLPDELLEYIDQEVASGAAPSRASVVIRALRRDRQRRRAEADARIYADLAARGTDDPDDLDGLVAWSNRQPLDLD
jgi:Arc/MetJ-type ribon-helix-helix transcriptional regulator